MPETATPPLAADFKDTPYWWEAAPPERTSSAPLPASADVVVVGSGFAGMCCALELARNGRKVAVLDAGDLGGGASSRSGAMVTGGQKLVVTDAITGSVLTTNSGPTGELLLPSRPDRRPVRPLRERSMARRQPP